MGNHNWNHIDKKENDGIMVILTINIPRLYYDALDIVKLHYPSRSEALRTALRDFLIKELEFNGNITRDNHDMLINNVKMIPLEKSNKIKTKSLEKSKRKYTKKIPLGNAFYINGGDDGK